MNLYNMQMVHIDHYWKKEKKIITFSLFFPEEK